MPEDRNIHIYSGKKLKSYVTKDVSDRKHVEQISWREMEQFICNTLHPYVLWLSRQFVKSHMSKLSALKMI
jgi:hypothetical protein